MIYYEHAEIGHILTKLYRKRAIFAGYVGQENGPEFAILEERVVELMLVALPVILDSLQTRRCAQQQIGLDLAWICDLAWRGRGLRP
jgi:hypothetical protein